MRQLPINQAIGHMVSSTLNNLSFAFKAQWPWFVVVALVITAMSYAWGFDLLTNEAELKTYLETNPTKAAQFSLMFFATIFLFLMSFASIAVNWHRYVLIDDVPTKLLEKLRVDGLVWRYFGNIILITLCLVVLTIPLAAVLVPLSALGGALVIPLALGYIIVVMLPILYRLSIKLPAVAIGRKDFGFGEAWKASVGNWWQIVGVAVIFTLISWGLGLVLAMLSLLLQKVLGPVVGVGVDMVIQIVINWILTVMGITMLTSFYGYFVEKRDF